MRISHRLRLAGVSTAASGIVLAVLFGATLISIRAHEFAQRGEELKTALDAFTLDPQEPFDLHEFQEAHPNFSCAVFNEKRSLPVEGMIQPDGRLMYGKRFQGSTIVVGADERETERGLRLIGVVLLVLWAPLTLLVGVATYFAARSVFRPLERLTAQATQAAGSHLGERLLTDDRAEFGEFAAALNGMLARIEEEVRRGDRFAADAAHELRTPLAILRTRIDTALLNPRSPGEYEETLRRALNEIVRLTDVTQALLKTARGEIDEAGPLALQPLVRAEGENWQERFSERGVALEVVAEDAHARITLEEGRMVLDNLLDNALRFAPGGSRVLLSLAKRGDGVEISVIDYGPGISEALGDRVFDRLIRADDSRNRASGGAGIGLSVVRRIAESRGGEAFHRKTPGGGATMIVRLPEAERFLSEEGSVAPSIVSE
ncbi:hypothetical protein BH11ARM2_BH11ARM2_10440 [soil metagenome]